MNVSNPNNRSNFLESLSPKRKDQLLEVIRKQRLQAKTKPDLKLDLSFKKGLASALSEDRATELKNPGEIDMMQYTEIEDELNNFAKFLNIEGDQESGTNNQEASISDRFK